MYVFMDKMCIIKVRVRVYRCTTLHDYILRIWTKGLRYRHTTSIIAYQDDP